MVNSLTGGGHGLGGPVIFPTKMMGKGWSDGDQAHHLTPLDASSAPSLIIFAWLLTLNPLPIILDGNINGPHSQSNFSPPQLLPIETPQPT